MPAVRRRSPASSPRTARSRRAFSPSWSRCPPTIRPAIARAHAERAAAAARGRSASRSSAIRCPTRKCSANGMVSAVNLVVRERFGDGPVIACNAHGDVVPPGLGWTADPYGAEIRDGQMYGRGVAVSKSDFATYAYALLALKASGAPLEGGVELHFTYDEEVGRRDRPEMAARATGSAGPTSRSAPASPTASPPPTTAACIWKSRCSASPGTPPSRDKGVDALEAANGILAELYALRKTLRRDRAPPFPGIVSPTLVVGLIAGGINTNVVPDNVKFRLDRRIIPEENPAEVERALTAQIARVRAQVAGHTVQRPPHPARGAVRARCRARKNWSRRSAAAARKVLGEEIPARGVPLYTDARHYSAAGIPDRALRRRPAHARGGERPPRRREAEARRPVQGDRGRGARLCGSAGRTLSAAPRSSVAVAARAR